MSNDEPTADPRAAPSGDPGVPAASAREWTVSVDAAVPWNHTGIRLEAGQPYAFTAEGRWFDAQHEAGPDGYASPNVILRLAEFKRRFRRAPWFALTGAIDEDPTSQFVIGSVASFTPTRSGELTCFANDWMSKYGNNRGTVTLTVRAR